MHASASAQAAGLHALALAQVDWSVAGANCHKGFRVSCMLGEFSLVFRYRGRFPLCQFCPLLPGLRLELPRQLPRQAADTAPACRTGAWPLILPPCS